MQEHLLGQTLDHYKITEYLGGGGMGSVFKAQDVTLQRDVAIKIMHQHIAEQADFRERFLQEARTAARLKHSGIVQVFDFGSIRSLLFIVMEFIPGANLEKMLHDLKAAGKWVPLSESVHIIRHVSLALDYAHKNGVLHRDIKPGNIMIEPVATDGFPYRPIITDLGLAKLTTGGLVTSDGTSMGTPAYMSPEQALGQPTDPRSDVYSLGVLLFELATGQRPFPVKTLTEAIHYHTKQPPPPPSSINPGLPQDLEELILKAMQKEPDTRFLDAAELATSLQNISFPAEKIQTEVQVQDSVSLMTQYQDSLMQPRGASILKEFATPTNLTRDQIQVLTSGKAARNYPMKAEGLTIGRGADCDIILDDPKASRQHARIEFDGRDYRVIDLNSSNGTFMSNTRLLPGIPETWIAENALRIGDTWLRLRRAEGSPTGSAAGTVAQAAIGTRVDLSRVQYSGGDRRVGLYLETMQATVEPGKSVSLRVVLLNLGSLVDHFTLSIAGVPAAWTPGFPQAVQLMPGMQQEINLNIQPPRTSQSRAGRYALTIKAVSGDDPAQFAEATPTLTVAAYSQFSIELQPERLRVGQPGRIVVRNQGNTPETFTFEIKDRADELKFTPTQPRLTVPENQAVVTEYKVQPRARRWIGSEKVHSFSARVIPPSGDAQTLVGEAISRALLPPWVLPLMTILCLALAAGLLFYLNKLRVDQVALSQARDAESATATWMVGDDDRDGLSNQVEMSLGMIPTMRDTDTDGLDDGEELNIRKTNPLNPDSDGDGLKDGDEVARGMNPLNTDTDADGIPDAQDQVPLQTSTPTPDAQATAQTASEQTAVASATLAAIAADTTAQFLATQDAAASATQAAAQTGTQQAIETQNAITNAQAATQTAIASATQAVIAATATAKAELMSCYTGNWVPTNPDGGMSRLKISKVNDETVTFQGYGECTPTDCDWGTINVPLADPMVGTYQFGFKSTRITLECSGSNLLAEVFDNYTPADGRTDRTSNYILKRQLILNLTLVPAFPINPPIISP